MANVVNWFEIPAADFDRAKAFYEAMYAKPIRTMQMEALPMAFLPMEGEGAGGAIVHRKDFYSPGTAGVLIYLNANPNLDEMLGRVEAAGGKILIGKRLITPEIGYTAVFLDSEGNRIALHSQQ